MADVFMLFRFLIFRSLLFTIYRATRPVTGMRSGELVAGRGAGEEGPGRGELHVSSFFQF
jgi:hypothetical protein